MKKQIAISACILSLFLRMAGLSFATSGDTVKFKEFRLSNGLTVILHEDPTSPVVAVGLWYKVGSKNEASGKTGFAHLFEHYMFEGDAYSDSGDYFKYLLGMGGEVNANTWYDRTYYYAVVPPGGVEEVLRLESNRMATLREKINEDALNKQRKIVKNEKRMRENQPYAEENKQIDTIGWGNPSHPYGHNGNGVIGSMEDLDSASTEDVRRFHKMYYAPNNAILAVSGAHDSNETLWKIQKWFGAIPSGPNPPRVEVPNWQSTGYGKVTLRDDKVKSARVTMMYLFPGIGKPGNAELPVISALLGGGRSSRLIDSLQYKKQIVTSVGSGAMLLQETSMLLIQAVPAPGFSPEQVEKAVTEEIELFIQNGASNAEMKRVKAQMRTQQLDSMQEAENMASVLTEGKAIGNTGQFN
ncbi:MAG: pitrilysin family protein, partial [bacterium]